jgi:hypothetical protein
MYTWRAQHRAYCANHLQVALAALSGSADVSPCSCLLFNNALLNKARALANSYS